MVSTIQIGNQHFAVVHVKPADRAIVQHEPGLQSVGSLAPGQIEHGANQVPEEATMTDKYDTLFRLTVPVAVSCQQFCPNALGAQLAYLLRFKGPVIPPAGAVQTRGQVQFRELLFKIAACFARQALELHVALPAEDAAALVNLLPRRKRNRRLPPRNEGSCMHGAFHQAGVDVGEPKAMTVMDIPALVFPDALQVFQILSHDARLLSAQFSQYRIRAFHIIWLAPASVIYR